MVESLFPSFERQLREYFLTRYQPEWLEAHGYSTLSLREFLKDPEVRNMPGLAQALLSPLSEKAAADEWERNRIKREQQEQDDALWCIRYNGAHPPQPALFDEFDTMSNPSLVEACEATKRWAFELGPSILTLSGPPGVGKTHLARAAWTHLEKRQRYPIWCVEGKVVADLHAALPKQRVQTITSCLEIANWLILDDLGVTAQGDWIRGIFDQFIDTRWASAPNLRTMFTTNLSASDLPSRIASRLRDKERARAVVMEAPDYRLTGPK